MIISGKIDVTKIVKDKMFKGAKGTYLDITITTNREKDQYGNDGIITQDLGKEARAKKERGPILGNVRIVYADQPAPPKDPPQSKSNCPTAGEKTAKQSSAEADSELPF